MVVTTNASSLGDVKLEYKPLKYPVPNSDVLPKMYFVALFVGSRGSGKTYSACQLLKMYEEHGIEASKKLVDQRIILMSPTSTANPVFTSLRHLSDDDIVENYTDNKLLDVLTDVRTEKAATDKYKADLKLWKKFRRCKYIEELDPEEVMELERWDFKAPEPPRYPRGCVTFLVLDDLVGSSAFKATGKSALTNLCLKNRHLAINILICTQNLKAIPKAIRLNTSLFVIFRFASSKVVCDDLYEEVSNTLKIEQFTELYEFATRLDHNALIIDFSQPKAARFKMNWSTVVALVPNGC